MMTEKEQYTNKILSPEQVGVFRKMQFFLREAEGDLAVRTIKEMPRWIYYSDSLTSILAVTSDTLRSEGFSMQIGKPWEKVQKEFCWQIREGVELTHSILRPYFLAHWGGRPDIARLDTNGLTPEEYLHDSWFMVNFQRRREISDYQNVWEVLKTFRIIKEEDSSYVLDTDFFVAFADGFPPERHSDNILALPKMFFNRA